MDKDIGRQMSARDADAREARAPVWSRDGTEIFYQSGGAVMSVPVSTDGGFTSGSSEVVFNGTLWPFVGEGQHYEVHPDGRRFLRIRREVRMDSEGAANEVVVVENWFEEVRERVGN